MSDWEPEARNAFHKIYPELKIYGCWFHYTQRIWAKTQKLGLSQTFRNNLQLGKYIKELLAIPILPASLIYPTNNLLQMPSLEDAEMIKLENLKKYFRKRWVKQISPEELSIYETIIVTNNSAESYHSKLKSIIKTCHPRIWTFIGRVNNIIQDTENGIGRLNVGHNISRLRKYKDINNEERREICKAKLRDGYLLQEDICK